MLTTNWTCADETYFYHEINGDIIWNAYYTKHILLIYLYLTVIREIEVDIKYQGVISC